MESIIIRPKSSKVDNVLKQLLVYKENNSWGFDDASCGLYHELFVSGADKMCDVMSGGNDKFIVTFSDIAFPSAKLRADWVDGEMNSGTNYYCEQLQQPLWLCPALSCYFRNTPKTIYIDFKN